MATPSQDATPRPTSPKNSIRSLAKNQQRHFEEPASAALASAARSEQELQEQQREQQEQQEQQQQQQEQQEQHRLQQQQQQQQEPPSARWNLLGTAEQPSAAPPARQDLRLLVAHGDLRVGDRVEKMHSDGGMLHEQGIIMQTMYSGGVQRVMVRRMRACS
jgi:hypothetical protein